MPQAHKRETPTQKNVRLHVEVVTGTLQIVRHIHENRGTSISFADLFSLGAEGKSERANMFIVEFVKDGVGSLSTAAINRVVNGDYSQLWSIANSFMKNFGHPPIEPVPIVLT